MIDNVAHQPTKWQKRFLDLAIFWSKYHTCDRGAMGVVIVRGIRAIATGYNGAPTGSMNCDDVGHAMLTNHCVPGDTVISKFQPGYHNSRHSTIKYIYEKWQDMRGRHAMKKMIIRSVTPEGMIVPDHIVDIWKNDEQPLIKIFTRLGRSVRTTSNHLIRIKDGWMKMGDVKIGDMVALNGQALYDNSEWLRHKYIDENKTQVDIAKIAGCHRLIIRKRLDRFGIERREFWFGGWNKGLRRSDNHNYKGRNVKACHARMRSRKYGLKDVCEVCGGLDNLQVHHIDGDPWNDSDENLMTLCVGCHTLAHTPHAKRKTIVFDSVLSIEDAGVEDVFDVQTKKYYNFIGDGVVLHNCRRTVHAEANAIAQAAKYGTSVDGCDIYITAFPCWDCAKLLAACGIKNVYYIREYHPEEWEFYKPLYEQLSMNFIRLELT